MEMGRIAAVVGMEERRVDNDDDAVAGGSIVYPSLSGDGR
jgi:hypothetical protein